MKSQVSANPTNPTAPQTAANPKSHTPYDVVMVWDLGFPSVLEALLCESKRQ
jgi:hypothetical protein